MAWMPQPAQVSARRSLRGNRSEPVSRPSVDPRSARLAGHLRKTREPATKSRRSASLVFETCSGRGLTLRARSVAGERREPIPRAPPGGDRRDLLRGGGRGEGRGGLGGGRPPEALSGTTIWGPGSGSRARARSAFLRANLVHLRTPAGIPELSGRKTISESQVAVTYMLLKMLISEREGERERGGRERERERGRGMDPA